MTKYRIVNFLQESIRNFEVFIGYDLDQYNNINQMTWDDSNPLVRHGEVKVPKDKISAIISALDLKFIPGCSLNIHTYGSKGPGIPEAEEVFVLTVYKDYTTLSKTILTEEGKNYYKDVEKRKGRF